MFSNMGMARLTSKIILYKRRLPNMNNAIHLEFNLYNNL